MKLLRGVGELLHSGGRGPLITGVVGAVMILWVKFLEVIKAKLASRLSAPADS